MIVINVNSTCSSLVRVCACACVCAQLKWGEEWQHGGRCPRGTAPNGRRECAPPRPRIARAHQHTQANSGRQTKWSISIIAPSCAKPLEGAARSSVISRRSLWRRSPLSSSSKAHYLHEKERRKASERVRKRICAVLSSLMATTAPPERSRPPSEQICHLSTVKVASIATEAN